MDENKLYFDIIDSIESMCQCSSKIIELKKSGVSPSTCEALAERIADVKVNLDALASELRYQNDVTWWMSRKVKRMESSDEVHDLQVSTNELKILDVALKQFKRQCESDGKNTSSIDALSNRIQLNLHEWECEA